MGRYVERDVQKRGGVIAALLVLMALCGPGTWALAEYTADIALDEAAAQIAGGFSLEVVSVGALPGKTRRVYLYHTHTYEAYEMDADHRYTPTETWRTADHRYNMVRVGEELTACLQSAGVMVTHDTADYEMPRLSTAYSRSLEGIRAAAREGYDLYIDLHRDSYSKGNGPNTVQLRDVPCARLLILIGQGKGTSFDEKPDWQANEKAARVLCDALNERAEGLCRGVSLKSGRYNQQAATPSMLIEVGNNQNTLPQALAAMEPLARAICQYFDQLE